MLMWLLELSTYGFELQMVFKRRANPDLPGNPVGTPSTGLTQHPQPYRGARPTRSVGVLETFDDHDPGKRFVALPKISSSAVRRSTCAHSCRDGTGPTRPTAKPHCSTSKTPRPQRRHDGVAPRTAFDGLPVRSIHPRPAARPRPRPASHIAIGFPSEGQCPGAPANPGFAA